MGFKEGVGDLPWYTWVWPYLLMDQGRAWSWCQCQWQCENDTLFNNLHCVVYHILANVMWLDTGTRDLALVSISVTVRDWHAIQQFMLFTCHILPDVTWFDTGSGSAFSLSCQHQVCCSGQHFTWVNWGTPVLSDMIWGGGYTWSPPTYHNIKYLTARSCSSRASIDV